MSLIPCERHTVEDLEVWSRLERLDRLRVLQGRRRMDRMEAAAMEAIRAFFAAGPGYVGTSWGKDSVVVAHLARRVDPEIPICWVVTPVWENPHCYPVRDAFLRAHPGAYREYLDHELPVVTDSATGLPVAVVDDNEAWPPAVDFGPRYVSGIRAEESPTRKLRVMAHGLTTARTCAPIGRWSADDVFAYLARYDLPVHPAYAMTRGGLLERGRLRVAPLGDARGLGVGRRQWEEHYYGEELAAGFLTS